MAKRKTDISFNGETYSVLAHSNVTNSDHPVEYVDLVQLPNEAIGIIVTFRPATDPQTAPAKTELMARLKRFHPVPGAEACLITLSGFGNDKIRGEQTGLAQVMAAAQLSHHAQSNLMDAMDDLVGKKHEAILPRR